MDSLENFSVVLGQLNGSYGMQYCNLGNGEWGIGHVNLIQADYRGTPEMLSNSMYIRAMIEVPVDSYIIQKGTNTDYHIAPKT